MRRLPARVPEMRPPHLDYRPLTQMGDELHLYPLLLAAGIAAGAGVLYAAAWN
ncbi:hypothetical protein [Methylobacterium sp. ARG-1]|uniref:hypothetical protein n=1 Tax=Methylobacterium sp. ARG-1 TaxID=1692501 RepID=UPI001364D137|nr:hypothetical protein [Methylobacterium sp. ARG-1]